MALNTNHLKRCIETLQMANQRLSVAEPESIDYEMFRNALVKGFELTLETSGKLLRKALKPYGGSSREIDALTYKDVFRRAAKHGLLTPEAVDRWFKYRDNRNDTAHDYGILFAEETVKLMADFLKDAKELERTLEKQFKEKNA